MRPRRPPTWSLKLSTNYGGVEEEDENGVEIGLGLKFLGAIKEEMVTY